MEIIRKITTGKQVTLPQEFIDKHDLMIGENVSMSFNEKNMLVIKPHRNVKKALIRMEKLFSLIREEFEDEKSLIATIDEERNKARKGGHESNL